MAKKNRQPIVQQPPKQAQIQEESVQSELSSEDDDAALLTSKVEEKLLSTIAKIKLKHPSIYEKTDNVLFEDEDFEDQEEQHSAQPEATNKFTYKQMLKKGADESDQQDDNLPIAVEQKRAKQSFKKALKQNSKKIDQQKDDLFKVITKVGKKEQAQEVDEKTKFKELTSKFDKQSKKLIKKVWKSDDLDETDLFLKDYILDKKWLTSKHKANPNEEQEVIDEEDEKRSQEMDQYEAEYNFRFEEPGGTTITQYPRQVKNSLRQKPQTRKQKRKKTIEKKKQQQLELRKEAQIKKQALKKDILEKLVPEDEEIDHDWYFCDDCCKGLQQKEIIWQCSECEDYILCEQCNQIIIHKHPLEKSRVPKGSGAPENCDQALVDLKSCKVCRRRVPTSKDRYQFTDRSYIVNVMCEHCYDQSNLEMKKKYKKVEAEEPNYAEMLEQNPEKIKELTNQKDIQQMVDEYLRNDFEGVLSGGLKTKFKYISVPAESYGLSDQQILFGDDKELNNYVSVKRLAPYSEEKHRLRNHIFNKKIKSIKKSVKNNKQLLKKGEAQLHRAKLLAKMKAKANATRQRRTKRLRIVNLSNKEQERNHFVSSSRLLSYGIQNQDDQGNGNQR